MKSELKVQGATLVKGVPAKIAEGGSSSGRLIKAEKYRVIGYADVAGTKEIPNGWSGVAVERLSTGTHVVVGVNTLLGKSIVFVGKGTAGASEKGYKVYEVTGNCFTSVNDFQATEDEDNNTVFVVSETPKMKANVKIKPASLVEVPAEQLAEYTATKDKQFYVCTIAKESV